MWRLLALLLHLGNLEYEWDEEVGSAVQIRAPQVGLEALAGLIGTTTAGLVDGIRMKTTSSGRGSILSIPLNLDQTRNNVQAVIKFMYGGVFHWLVKKINSCHSTMTTGKKTSSFIGILGEKRCLKRYRLCPCALSRIVSVVRLILVMTVHARHLWV